MCISLFLLNYSALVLCFTIYIHIITDSKLEQSVSDELGSSVIQIISG